MKTDQPVAVSREDRSPAQFFFEIGFGACLAEAFVRNETFPFTVTDEIVERAWAIAGEAHEDPAEFDHYLRLATRDGAVERLRGLFADANMPELAVDPDDRPGMAWNDHIVQADNQNMRVAFMSNSPDANARSAAIVAAVNYVRALLAEPVEGEGK